MRTVAQDVYGSSEVLRVADVPLPEPAEGEVLVRVAAASLNAADWHIMRGEPRLARIADRSVFGRRAPREPVRGRDLAGTVEAVGSGVTQWRVGDEVLGEHAATFAEHVAVPAACLARKPATVSFAHAAALPLAATTADLVLEEAGVVRGSRVLVLGASGGVGTYAVQLAVARGAQVTGVCSTRNLELVRSLGAVEVVDYRTEDVARSGATYDAVVDLVGNRGLLQLRRLVARGGTLVLSGGGNPGEGRHVGPLGLMVRGALLGRLLGLRVRIPLAKPDAERLAHLVAMVEDGRLRPVVERTYPLAEAPAAMHHLEVAHARGKIVVTVDRN